MMRTIDRRTGRVILMLFVFCSFIGCILSLFYIGRGGAISGPVMRDSLTSAVTIYMPLLSVMAAFLFDKRGRNSQADTELETLLFAVALVACWCLPAPLLLLLTHYPVEYIFDLLQLKGLGIALESPAVAGVAYYFNATRK